MLAMVQKAGLATPYALLDAGLPLGVTGIVLLGLERKGLVERGPRGARGKRTYRLTANGEQVLGDEGARLSESDIPASSESLQRRLWVALVTGADVSSASGYLGAARWDRIEAATSRLAIPVHPEGPRSTRSESRKDRGLSWRELLETTEGALRQPTQDPLQAWLRIRAVCEIHRLRGEVLAYEQLMNELGPASTGDHKDERDKNEHQ